jgi:D-inositol-3-phosphate glycosyltransferase
MSDAAVQEKIANEGGSSVAPMPLNGLEVCLLTGGNDRPYALGMALALAEQRVTVDFIGSDALDAPELHSSVLINVLNLRGDQNERASLTRKFLRIVSYYARLVKYGATAKPRIFHILWNNKFEFIDRVPLMLFYRLFGKRVVLTAHNVNMRKRDRSDTVFNRLTLRFQYRLCSHIFVHTEQMRAALVSDFRTAQHRITVIPFGINNTIPKTAMTPQQARKLVGVSEETKTALFFGQIAPYKGLEYLLQAMMLLGNAGHNICLIIAGKIKRGYEKYWNDIWQLLGQQLLRDRIIISIGFIPENEVERYFKVADVVVLPYVQIFQSGVPFLAYSFGVPVIATDVGSFKDDVIVGKTGFICRPCDAADLARGMEGYYSSDLYRNLATNRAEIKRWANERHSWSKVGTILRNVYEQLLVG